MQLLCQALKVVQRPCFVSIKYRIGIIMVNVYTFRQEINIKLLYFHLIRLKTCLFVFKLEAPSTFLFLLRGGSHEGMPLVKSIEVIILASSSSMCLSKGLGSYWQRHQSQIMLSFLLIFATVKHILQKPILDEFIHAGFTPRLV